MQGLHQAGPTLRQVLKTLDERPTVASYLQAAREIRALSEPSRPLRVALLSTFTIDLLAPYLYVEAARYGFDVDIYVAPFNSVHQELLDPTSGCFRHRPDVVFIIQALADVSPPLANDFLSLDGAARMRYVEAVEAELVSSVRAFRDHSSAAVVIGNFAKPRYVPLGIYEVMAAESLTATIEAVNARMAVDLPGITGVYVLDFDRICADVGYRNAVDDRMRLLGRAPLSSSLLPALATTQATFIRALTEPRRKCLVLDLDNTLWGGIIGESGVPGIQLGHTFPGSVYREFQQKLLELHRRGILLAINSKNNPADVDDVFRAHPDMVLKREHFSSIRVNWQDKPQNMLEIAAELNIGTDSLVFFDDSLVERERMRQVRPEVLTLEVPADPIDYVRVLCERGHFDRMSHTSEDRRRGEMYARRASRQELRASASSMHDFLHGLEMAACIQPLDRFSFPRVLDLLQKTNQFNLTTRRHSASQLERLMSDPAWSVFSLQVQDRFGDEGIVGVTIVERQHLSAIIDSFLLSCRVIGRTLETALITFIAEWARAQGLERLAGDFLPTAKNAPAADFYQRHGFIRSEGSLWELDLTAAAFRWPEYIARAVPATVQTTDA